MMAKVEVVLPDEYTDVVKLEKAWACHIVDKKFTSKIIREFSVHFPIPQWLHLKRVRNNKDKDEPLSVLVCPCDDDTPEQTPTFRQLSPAVDIPQDSLGPLFTVSVPKFAPLTRKQFEQCSKSWPVNFHEDKNIAKLLSGEFLDKDELENARSYMLTAWKAAETTDQHNQTNCGCADGCVIVDPTSSVVLATGSSVVSQHLLHHAVMVTIDLIAKQQGGGVYQYPDNCSYLKESVAIPNPDDKTGPYLCTGYDVYLPTEPCAMCAMALVHSRVRRVFYSRPSSGGALGSAYKIHVQTGLNHHYQVFKNLLNHPQQSPDTS